MQPRFNHPASLVNAFGLNYQLSVAYPGLRAAPPGAVADVVVHEGEVPATLPGATILDAYSAVLPQQLLLTTRTIANFLVVDGTRIVFQPKPGADAAVIGNLLFGWATGGLLLQRKVLALHASTLLTPGGAVALCGESGVGKSTLAGLLMARGFPVFDDNIAALSFTSPGTVCVSPGLGSIRLYPDSLSWMGGATQGLAALRGQPAKYIFPLPAAMAAGEKATLKAVFILRRAKSLAITAVPALQKIQLLQRHTFMGRWVSGMQCVQDIFQHWLNVCRSVPLFYLDVPEDLAPGVFADQLAQRLSKPVDFYPDHQ